MTSGEHQPVLLDAVMEGLAVRADGIYIDATFGRGGHTRGLLAQLGPDGRVLALDQDPEAVAAARALDDARVTAVQGSFADLEAIATANRVHGKVQGLLMDLGVSSPQLDDPARGFSFRHEGPLDMRMDPAVGPSAAEWLAGAEESEIRRVLREYGEEPRAGKLARAIVARRRSHPIETTRDLAELVAAELPAPKRRPGKPTLHPATRVFQAIRIHVNRELEVLSAALPAALEVLAVGGRLVVISFHSLEDRQVKRFIRDQSRGDPYPPDLPVRDSALRRRLRAVGKAVRAGPAEQEANPRARSAVLRIAEKVG